jgi:hypothetical protein
LSLALQRIADELSALYDTPRLPDVAAFLCDEATMRHAVGPEVDRGEVLAVLEEDGVSFVGLYVAAEVLDALAEEERADEDFQRQRFRTWQLAVEGVSHLVYLCFRADRDESVSALELELQAEVDKWALGLLRPRMEAHPLAGWGAPRLAQSRSLRRRLFADARFLDEPGTEAGDRYRAANRIAAGFVEGLEARHLRHVDGAGERALVGELRRFYRDGGANKLAGAARRAP